MPHRQTIFHGNITGQSLPILQWVGWKDIQYDFYRENKQRDKGSLSVQISMKGLGAYWPDACSMDYHEIPPHHILLFFNGEDNLAYGTHPESEHWELAYFNISGEAALTIGRDIMRAHGQLFAIHDPTSLWQIMNPLMPAQRGKHTNLAETQRADLGMKLLLALWESARAPVNADDHLIQQAQSLMLKKINITTVEATARELKISREHLTRLFKARGLPSPAAWLREQRLNLAEVLICADEAPLSEISLFVGFESYSHFHRVMTKRLGCSPGKHRKDNLAQ